MLGLDDYRTRWLAFSERFLDASAEQRSRLATEVVEGGLPTGRAVFGFDPSAAERGAVEAAVIRAAGLFDAFGYQQHNPDIYWNLCGHQEELEHFVDPRLEGAAAPPAPTSTCGTTGATTSTPRART